MHLLDNPIRLSSKQQMLQKLEGKLWCWAFRFLNLAFRMILLKDVPKSIPIYQLLGMPTPKGACSKMVDIFKKLLWGGAQQIRKWALVSWQGLTKEKMDGGLGLRDPYILNQNVGVKLRWWWIVGGRDLWKHIWTIKYNMSERTEDILRYRDPPNGLKMWNLTAQNKHPIY